MQTNKPKIKKHLNKLIVFKFILILFSSIYFHSSSAQPYCLTPTKSNKTKFRQSFQNRIAQNSYYLKIYVHIIRRSDGTGGYNAIDLDEILGYLDEAYNPHNIFFEWDDNIDFIDDDLWAAGPGVFFGDEAIYQVNNHNDGIDIYLFPETAGGGSGRANGVGESSEFWVAGTRSGYGPAAKSTLIAHEMGHVLNLWHTHHGCEAGGIWEAVDGSNCASAGDLVCDTPADPNIYFDVDPVSCEWQYYADCYPPEDVYSYMPDTKNIMAYSNLNCREYLTEGQGERMRESIATLPYLQAVLVNAFDSSCNIDDWNALKQLYTSTNGDMWTNNANWDLLKQDSIPEGCSLRGLHGVTFNASGRVTGLNLYNNNLTGTLPAAIGDFTNLKYLDFGFNLLTDTIPTQISNLSNLEILFLDSNQFIGNIPVGFINLGNLVQLHLKNNLLEGCFAVELKKFCGLKSNNLSISEGNNFDAPFESFCEIGEGICPIPRCNIKDWNALKKLYKSTSGNSWTDNLNWNIVTSNLPEPDCNLRKLRGVSLNEFDRVTGIDLYDNNLTGNLPSEIGDLTELTYLDLGFNGLVDTIPAAIKNLTQLSTLYLDNNMLSGILPPGLTELTSLRLMHLNSNKFYGCLDTSFLNLCTQLNPSYNKNEYISDGNGFYADWENFCDTGVDACSEPSCFEEWIVLKQLYISTNGDDWTYNNNWEIVLEEVPPPDCDLSDLFGIETNEDGSITAIKLQSNNLSGTIPEELGNLQNLADLYLSTNLLTGNIPGALGNLINIESMYLSYNNLTGCYDANLANLCMDYYNYSIIDISYSNNLDASWFDFCETGEGQCIAVATEAKCNDSTLLNLNGIHSEEEEFHSGESINSSAIINAKIIYKAGNTIQLNPGLTADGKNDFDVQIETCK